VNEEGPRLDQINLIVSNMPASVAFYRRLGLAIPDSSPDWDDDHRSAAQPGDIDIDFDSIKFAQAWDGGWRGGPGIVIGFRLASRESVDALYESLTREGYRGQQPPYDAFWGARYAVVEDPDGNPVGLMSPIDPARRTGPTPPGA
jgi:catechol 2,3-dioxygenase-like lactoylglutathione lyase family enzyme